MFKLIYKGCKLIPVKKLSDFNRNDLIRDIWTKWEYQQIQQRDKTIKELPVSNSAA
jgi:hypothetical protein